MDRIYKIYRMGEETQPSSRPFVFLNPANHVNPVHFQAARATGLTFLEKRVA